MSSGHTHAAGPEVTLRTTGRLRSALIAVVVLIALATAALAVWLWPRGGLPPSVAAPGISQTSVAAQVVSVRRHTCSGTSDDRAADGTVPATIACAAVRVRLLDGPDTGHVVDVQVTGPTIEEGLAPGVRATVARFPDTYPGGSGA